MPWLVIGLAVAGGLLGAYLFGSPFEHGTLRPSPIITSVLGKTVNVITLSWTYSDPNNPPPLGFQIERIDPEGNVGFFNVAGSASPSSFDDTGLAPWTLYQYRVRAIYSAVWKGGWSARKGGRTVPFIGTFGATLSEDEGGWEGRTLVQRIEAVRLSRSGTQVRLRLRASSTMDAYIENIYISQPDPARSPYDSAADLTPFYGKAVVAANTSLTLADTLPDVNYNLDEAQPLLIAIDFRPGGPSGIRFRDNVPEDQAKAYWEDGAEASIRNRSSDYNSENRIYFIELIEVG